MKTQKISLSAFVASYGQNLVIWCLTGGGDLFEENSKVFFKLVEENHPVLAIFSNAGALVQNRYGFFLKLTKGFRNKDNLLFLFEDQSVLSFNIQRILDDSNISYAVLPYDPSFARSVWLANQKIKCIIASPLTANSVAKLVNGIADNFIINLVSAGKKANQTIGIFPTDRGISIIESKLPVRQIKLLSKDEYSPNTCKYGAIVEDHSPYISYRPEYCTGCRECVKKYPDSFSVDEKMKIRIRSIDRLNTERISKEFRIFQNPEEIIEFINSKSE